MWAVAVLLLSLTPTDSTRLQGTVLSLASGHPLAGVRVSVPGAEATTDSTGRFALARASTRLTFVWNGVSGTGQTPDGQAEGTLRVVLDTEARDLDPSVEQNDWHLIGRWGMPGFFDRMRSGYGRFYTRDDAVRGGFKTLKDLLHTAGVSHGCLPSGGACGALVYYGAQPTLVSIYVDGAFQRSPAADDTPMDDVAGVEYYALPTPPRPVGPDRQWIRQTNYFQEAPLEEFTVVVWTRGFHRRPAPH